MTLDDGLSKRLLFKIRTEPPDPDWFDEVAGQGMLHKNISVAVSGSMTVSDEVAESLKTVVWPYPFQIPGIVPYTIIANKICLGFSS